MFRTRNLRPVGWRFYLAEPAAREVGRAMSGPIPISMLLGLVMHAEMLFAWDPFLILRYRPRLAAFPRGSLSDFGLSRVSHGDAVVRSCREGGGNLKAA